MTIARNIASIRERIAAAAEKSGRTSDDVCLVAVTKYVDSATTADVVRAGCTTIGESRPQVLVRKFADFSTFSDLPEVSWHLIGHLQRNKVARMVGRVDLIHSVDSLRLLNAINTSAESAGKSQKILLEVNVSGESAKHGFPPNGLREALDSAAGLEHLHVSGLMCMAGLGGSPDDARREFEQLRKLRDAHLDADCSNIELRELSMGMSGDFEAAVEQGATLVRIGSILFENTDR